MSGVLEKLVMVTGVLGSIRNCKRWSKVQWVWFQFSRIRWKLLQVFQSILGMVTGVLEYFKNGYICLGYFRYGCRCFRYFGKCYKYSRVY